MQGFSFVGWVILEDLKVGILESMAQQENLLYVFVSQKAGEDGMRFTVFTFSNAVDVLDLHISHMSKVELASLERLKIFFQCLPSSLFRYVHNLDLSLCIRF